MHPSDGENKIMNPLRNLVAAVRAVVADHNQDAREPAAVADVIALTRREVDLDDIRKLQQDDVTGPQLTAEEAAAYRQVLTADPDALRAAVSAAVAPAPSDSAVHTHQAVLDSQQAAAATGDAQDLDPWAGDLTAAAGERETTRPGGEYLSPAYAPAAYSLADYAPATYTHPAYAPAGREAAAGDSGDTAGEREADLPDPAEQAARDREAGDYAGLAGSYRAWAREAHESGLDDRAREFNGYAQFYEEQAARRRDEAEVDEQADAQDEAEVAGDDAEAAADLDAACAAECAAAAAAAEAAASSTASDTGSAAADSAGDADGA
jgi:hypothetical protein